MRFRLKYNGANGASKLELPGPACSFGELKCAVARQLFPEDPPQDLTELQLSFNNKDPIQGGDEQDVKALGIAPGDLLWVLRPQPRTDPPAPQPKRAKEEAPAQQARQAVAAPGSAQASAAQGAPASAVPMEEDGAGAAPAALADEHPVAVEEPAAGAAAMPSYLLRTLAQNSGGGGLSATTPAHVLLLAAHAALLEAGFEPTWVPAAGEPAWPPGGGLGVEAVAGSGSPYCLPAWVQTSATIFRLPYRLPALQQVQQGGVEGAEAAAGAGAAAQAGEPAAEPAPQAAPPCCTLQCSTMGAGTAVLVASTPKGHAHTLPLLASSFLEEADQAPQSQDDGPSTSSAAIAAAAEGPCWEGRGVGLLGGRYMLGPAAARRLWRALKDGLAFPMLLAAYADAGLPAPAGLLALPEDLKLAVLAQLNALQLVAVSATCAELRHLAASDELWRPLFEAEFPAASSFYTSQAQRRGYKWAFGACWRDRKQREEAVRRQRRFMPAIPNLGPRPPFYPPPAPFGVPGITGGDYDRLPQPFLGGGPGMYPGGGGLGGLGGNMFGGGGRRQGGRGGGGFHLF